MARVRLDAVTAVIDALYDGAHDSARMPHAIEELRRLFNSSKACFARHGPNVRPDDAISTHADPVFMERYMSEFAHEPNVLGAAVNAAPVGLVYRDHDLVGPERLRESRFWNEWMAPQDMYGGLACKVLADGPSSWFFDVQRGRHQPDFDADDARLLHHLKPTMVRVAQLWHRIGRLTIQRGRACHALDALATGLFIADAGSRLLYVNAAADDLLRRADGPLSWRGCCIFARDPAKRTRLQAMIAQACSEPTGTIAQDGCILLGGVTGERRRTAVFVTPMRDPSAYSLPDDTPLALVSLRELDAAESLERDAVELFGLTATEAKFAAALAGGRSLAEAARAQGVRMTTARSHLARILQKTGTRQQSQVAALMRGAQRPIRHSD